MAHCRRFSRASSASIRRCRVFSAYDRPDVMGISQAIVVSPQAALRVSAARGKFQAHHYRAGNPRTIISFLRCRFESDFRLPATAFRRLSSMSSFLFSSRSLAT